MKSESLYRIAVILLLSGIFTVQIIVLGRVQKSITASDIRAPWLTSKQRSELILHLPLVSVMGDLDVNVQNPVEIESQPIQVQIVR